MDDETPLVPDAGVPDPPDPIIEPPPLVVEVPTKPYPGLWQGLWLLAQYILLQTGLVIPFAVADHFTKGKLAKQPVIFAVVTLAAGILVIRAACSRLHMSFLAVAGPLPKLSILPPIALAVTGLVLAELPLLGYLSHHFPSLIPKQDYGLGESLWGAFLLIVLIAPVIEESLFRGILLRGFMARYSVTRGVLLSAALFGILHGSLLKLIPTVSLGLLLGWLYSELSSIWPGVFAHACNNSVVFVAAFAALKLPHTGSAPPASPAPTVAAELILSLAGLAMLGCGLLALRGHFAKSEARF